MKTDSGHEIVNADPKIHDIMTNHFEGFAKFGLKKVIPGDFYGTDRLLLKINELYNFQMRPTDVYVCSFQKVGSSWLKEIIWAIMHNKDLDHPQQGEDPYLKSPWFETEVILSPDDIPLAMAQRIPRGVSFFDIIASFPDPRILHTHIPFALLNPNTIDDAKVVYVIRDPRDVCVSYYHFATSLKLYGYTKTLETFVDDFVNGTIFCGSYLDHLRQWWPVRNHPNVYTIYFENIRREGPKEVKKLCEFLGVKLTDAQVANVVQYTSMAEMKKRQLIGKDEEAKNEYLQPTAKDGVYRKGEIGSSKSEMKPEWNAKIAKHFRENLGEIKLPYDFETDI